MTSWHYRLFQCYVIHKNWCICFKVVCIQSRMSCSTNWFCISSTSSAVISIQLQSILFSATWVMLNLALKINNLRQMTFTDSSLSGSAFNILVERWKQSDDICMLHLIARGMEKLLFLTVFVFPTCRETWTVFKR